MAALVEHAKVVIAEVNTAMPFTFGLDISPSRLDAKLGAKVIAGVRARQWAEVESLDVSLAFALDDDAARERLEAVDDVADTLRPTVWFALDESCRLAFSGKSRPLAFSGIWTRWTLVHKVRQGETTNDLFAFLTPEPHAVIAPIHPKAMVALQLAADVL